jgi:hypothetical protein
MTTDSIPRDLLLEPVEVLILLLYQQQKELVKKLKETKDL